MTENSDGKVTDEELLKQSLTRCEMLVHTALAQVLHDHVGAERQRTRIAAFYLMRALDDLTCFINLAITGFPMQAATIGASLWEKIQCASYVGLNDEIASEWEKNSEALESENQFWRSKPFKSGFESVAKSIGIPVTYDRALTHYKSLCAAKHNHPFHVANFAIKESDGSYVVYHGPLSGPAIRLYLASYVPDVVTTVIWGVLGFLQLNADLIRNEHELKERVQACYGSIRAYKAVLAKEFPELPREWEGKHD